MSYSNSPLLPKARRQAVNLVLKEGFSVTVAARKSGIARVTLYRWLKKARKLHPVSHIPTASSKPRSCPWALSEDVVGRVIELRKQTGPVRSGYQGDVVKGRNGYQHEQRQ